MALYEWSDDYSVGVGTMDSHHQKIFDIINKMHEDMKAGADESVVASAINELIDYTKFHFAEEEKIMEAINYTGIAGQKAAHKAFVDKLLSFKSDVDNGMA
ncbi:MAG: bacteriohemerythrin, partial [Gammaproteobacteria bacterium]|nr:bacteriohemerythrin [Gammaproteobacteria bacterium]